MVITEKSICSIPIYVPMIKIIDIWSFVDKGS